jgi:hypothetical protein
VAYHKIRRREIEVEGKVVVVDNVTNDNDIRKVRDPWEVARRLGKVLEVCGEAAAVVVMEAKHIRHLDVTMFNEAFHKLCVPRKNVFGCHTQVKMRDLGRDGYHVSPHCVDILDKTYACSILGIPVPCPTQARDFFHPMQNREYEAAWPRIRENGGGRMRREDQEGTRSSNAIHGWRW